MTAIELTICLNTNTLKSREYKIKQYKDLNQVTAFTTCAKVYGVILRNYLAWIY